MTLWHGVLSSPFWQNSTSLAYRWAIASGRQIITTYLWSSRQLSPRALVLPQDDAAIKKQLQRGLQIANLGALPPTLQGENNLFYG